MITELASPISFRRILFGSIIGLSIIIGEGFTTPPFFVSTFIPITPTQNPPLPLPS